MHREPVSGQQPAVAAVIPSANSAFQNTNAPSMAGIPNSMTMAASSMYAAANHMADIAASVDALQVVYVLRTAPVTWHLTRLHYRTTALQGVVCSHTMPCAWLSCKRKHASCARWTRTRKLENRQFAKTDRNWNSWQNTSTRVSRK